jgi:hypothetical protein
MQLHERAFAALGRREAPVAAGTLERTRVVESPTGVTYEQYAIPR